MPWLLFSDLIVVMFLTRVNGRENNLKYLILKLLHNNQFNHENISTLMLISKLNVVDSWPRALVPCGIDRNKRTTSHPK